MPKNSKLPTLPGNAPGENGFKDRPKHGVILVCKDEKSQAHLYDALNALCTCQIKVVAI